MQPVVMLSQVSQCEAGNLLFEPWLLKWPSLF
jgi:hypothetical protein